MKSLLLVLFSALVANTALAGQFCIGEYKSKGPESLFGFITYKIECEDGLTDQVSVSFSYSDKAARKFEKTKLAVMLNQHNLVLVSTVPGRLANRGNIQIFAVREKGHQVPSKNNVVALFRYVDSNTEKLSLIDGAGIQTTYPELEVKSIRDMNRMNQIVNKLGMKSSQVFYPNLDSHQVYILSK